MTSIKRMLGIAIIGAALTGAAALAQNVNVDIKSPSELTGYRSYSIEKMHATDPQIEPRLVAAIDRQLQLKGWHEVPKGGEVVVTAVLAGNDDPQQYSVFYGDLNNVNWNVPADPAMNGSVTQAPVGTLILDMYDNRTGQLIWRSTATDFLTNNSEKNVLKVDSAINKMFDSLPWDDTPFR